RRSSNFLIIIFRHEISPLPSASATRTRDRTQGNTLNLFVDVPIIDIALRLTILLVRSFNRRDPRLPHNKFCSSIGRAIINNNNCNTPRRATLIFHY
ncbi:hypothetical protein ACHAXS_002886, partial [Conticribra weissflogii]